MPYLPHPRFPPPVMRIKSFPVTLPYILKGKDATL
jgi:hypothetical protein